MVTLVHQYSRYFEIMLIIFCPVGCFFTVTCSRSKLVHAALTLLLFKSFLYVLSLPTERANPLQNDKALACLFQVRSLCLVQSMFIHFMCQAFPPHLFTFFSLTSETQSLVLLFPFSFQNLCSGRILADMCNQL